MNDPEPFARRPGCRHSRVESAPTGVVRLVLRLPIYLYRAGFGWLLGHRFLLLTHRGRTNGRVCQTVLEVVRYDPASREAVVVSGWGARADWFRNIMIQPALAVQIGHERYVPTQDVLGSDEVRAELVGYERRHPWAARMLTRIMGFRIAPGDSSRRAFADVVRMVAFRPAEES